MREHDFIHMAMQNCDTRGDCWVWREPFVSAIPYTYYMGKRTNVFKLALASIGVCMTDGRSKTILHSCGTHRCVNPSHLVVKDKGPGGRRGKRKMKNRAKPASECKSLSIPPNMRGLAAAAQKSGFDLMKVFVMRDGEVHWDGPTWKGKPVVWVNGTHITFDIKEGDTADARNEAVRELPVKERQKKYSSESRRLAEISKRQMEALRAERAKAAKHAGVICR